jgi:DNA end-binding protein Ku
MPRPIWNGVISFGLLNIPISLHTAEKRVDLHFRMIDSRNKKPIRYERVNAETGEEVPWKDIVQAFEYQKGNYVVLSEADMKSVAPEGKESIELEEFVDRDAIPPQYYEKPYYLLPGKKAEKGYVLLREILRKTKRVGIGHVMIRTRRYLSAVMPQGDALILNLLRFQQEIVPLDNFEFPQTSLDKLRISARELEMANELIDSMTVEWQPDRYIDDYRERLSQLVEKQLARKQGLIHEETAVEALPENAATNVVDFMALLKNSLNKKGGKREPVPAERSSSKKAAKSPTKSPPKKKLKAGTVKPQANKTHTIKKRAH